MKINLILLQITFKVTDKTQGGYFYTCMQPAVLSIMKHLTLDHEVLRSADP